MDAALAGRLLLAGQKSLSRVLADEAESPLDMLLADLDARGRAVCCRWLAEAQDMLQYGVTPARVLEALAARLFVAAPGRVPPEPVSGHTPAAPRQTSCSTKRTDALSQYFLKIRSSLPSRFTCHMRKMTRMSLGCQRSR